MIDIRQLRREPDAYIARLARKGAEQLGRELLEIDAAWRRETAHAESLRAEQKRSGKPSPGDLGDFATKKGRLQEAHARLTDLERRRKDLLDRIPNPPADDVPDGSEDDFTVLREVGNRPSFTFPARDHLDLAQAHGGIDTARGSKASGSRFVYRIGDLAARTRALPLRRRAPRTEGSPGRLASDSRAR